MARVIVVGGGVVGLGLAMLLAKDGHEVDVLERDPEPPPGAVDEAWTSWQRRGVSQFRLAHMFLARYREIVEAELPELVVALEKDGALRLNPLLEAPEALRGPPRSGDERFEVLTGRRVMVERTAAVVAEKVPGLTIRRGRAVCGLRPGAEAVRGVPHVTGVRCEDGAELVADVVIDASGRRSALPGWLEELGAQRPVDELEDSGFVYYGRTYRSRDGGLPVALGPALQEFGSISTLTLPADNNHWALALIARADDRELRRLKDVPTWEKVFGAMPTVAHWVDGEPLEDGVVTMAKIEDRIRHTTIAGRPVATGILAAADAWACTNPSLGRGASIGMMHARLVRDCLRDPGADDPGALSDAFAAATTEVVEPWYHATVEFDRDRLAEMGAIAAGGDAHDVPPTREMAKAMQAAALKDPDCFRAFVDVAMVLASATEVLNRPGLFDKIVANGAGWRDEPTIGPDRRQLVELVGS